MNTSDRLKKYIKNEGLTIGAFEKTINASNGYVNSISKGIGEEKLIPIIENYSNLNIEWLLTGIGEMLKSSVDTSILSEDSALAGYYLPNVNASAGLDSNTINQELNAIPIYIPNFGKDLVFINVFGDSMYPKYQSGEIIGLKEIEYDYLIPGHTYVVTMMNGEVYLKYVKQGKDDDHVILASENVFYEPKQFHKEKIKSFFVVKAVLSKTTI